ncbi:apolipoprotein N-acyltransferase [Polaribacter cellanae]|uniref:Apolipoprotein N-acyltransferase n=1 Tax=Polaribacter cellanae TaxID=2818493 RepID=A0A975CS87_9FLAO|nr:apolipoprotein N-acyltransferase [Polaribacter cellanae]QTE24337.1 apolipoprotein N-acyltransferase [Polaribacter cellanae]
METFFSKYKFLFVALSAILSAYAFKEVNYVLSIVSLVPVIIAIKQIPLKKVFLYGFLFGSIYAIILCFWMFSAFVNYTNNNAVDMAIGFIAISILMFAFFYSMVFVGIAFILNIHTNKNFLGWFQLIAITAFWSLLEIAFMSFLNEYPFHNYRVGFAFTKNIFSIQWASFGGIEILTFFTVLVNVLLAKAIVSKQKLDIKITVLAIVIIFLGGAILKATFTPQNINTPFKVSSISANMNVKDSWNQNKVNQLAENYFQLIKKQEVKTSDFIIFPESALPWTFYGKDDLLDEFQKRINPNTAIIIGLNTTENEKDKSVKNTVFYFKNKQELGRYQKEILIKGIEAPILGRAAPFAGNAQYLVEKNRFKNKLFTTPFGKAGILICNEAVISKHAIQQAQEGANFFFNLSNDAWFKEQYITPHHFYNARLMSVITRKDMVISNNCGYNAIIKGSGEIINKSKKNTKSNITGNLVANTSASLKTQYPLLFAILLNVFLIVSLFFLKKQN